jgi:indole-3-glycerol phosphate synthase
MATQAAPILRRIVDARRAFVAQLKASPEGQGLEQRARSAGPARDFRAALRTGTVAVIAECKQRSPSGGQLQISYDPVALAGHYVAGGAAAISVLTEPEFFGGSLEHLRAVRASVQIPILCKDFIIDRAQLFAARAAGADAILLITAVLDDPNLAELHAVAIELGMAAVVEVHSADEVRRALQVKAAMIGINNRDLTRMTTDRGTTARLRPLIPQGLVIISESGIDTAEDVQALRALGVDAVLVGESLLRAADLQAKLKELTEA